MKTITVLTISFAPITEAPTQDNTKLHKTIYFASLNKAITAIEKTVGTITNEERFVLITGNKYSGAVNMQYKDTLMNKRVVFFAKRFPVRN